MKNYLQSSGVILLKDQECLVGFCSSSLLDPLTRCSIHFTFTFMHLADAFIQSDLHCIQVTVSTFYQLLLSLGIEPMILALLTPCSTS